MRAERFKKLIPYVPGEQPQDRTYIKLNTNENPYPPSPSIREFLDRFDIENLRRYPDPASVRLREKIAGRYGLDKENIFAGNGSDEVLAFAFYAFYDSLHGPLLFPEYTYSFYPVYCDLYGIACHKIPLKEDFSIDIDDYLSTSPACGIIFPNPNAPTGIGLKLKKIQYLLDHFPKDRVVVIDEAYIDFDTGGNSAMPLISQYPNLLVVRTFSKSMALAGIRLGFAAGGKDLISALVTVKDSFNSYPVDMLAQKIGELAVEDEAYFQDIKQKIIRSREGFSAKLRELGWQVLPSSANFVFAGKPGLTGQEIYLKLKEQGVLVRHFNTGRIREFVRITVGTSQEMARLLDAAGRLSQ